MLTMIGLARVQPMTKPWIAVTAAPRARAAKSPSIRPPAFTADANITDAAAVVTPRASDMMLPLSEIIVMPAATQPTNDVVVSSERRLGVEKKLGVIATATASASSAAARTDVAIDGRCNASAFIGQAADAWVMSLRIELILMSAASYRATTHPRYMVTTEFGHPDDLLEIRRRHDQSPACIAKLAHEAIDFRSCPHIDAARRLVHQQQTGPVIADNPPEQQFLLIASRQLVATRPQPPRFDLHALGNPRGEFP